MQDFVTDRSSNLLFDADLNNSCVCQLPAEGKQSGEIQIRLDTIKFNFLTANLGGQIVIAMHHPRGGLVCFIHGNQLEMRRVLLIPDHLPKLFTKGGESSVR